MTQVVLLDMPMEDMNQYLKRIIVYLKCGLLTMASLLDG